MSCAESMPVLELEIDCALASSNVFNLGVSDVIQRLRAERERLRKELQELSSTDGRTEKIEWFSASAVLPDSDMVVLIANTIREPWIGFYDDESEFWRNADGSACTSAVTHWAELPNGPQ